MSIDGVTRSEDYAHGCNGLPPADVLKLYFAEPEAWAAIRPSGTEPKLKLYIGVRTGTYGAAKEALEVLKDRLLNLFTIC
jgi:phosphoglucomutase